MVLCLNCEEVPRPPLDAAELAMGDTVTGRLDVALGGDRTLLITGLAVAFAPMAFRSAVPISCVTING